MLPEDRLDAQLTRDLAGMPRLEWQPGDDALEHLLIAASAFQPLRAAQPSAGFSATLEARLLSRFSVRNGVLATDSVPAEPAGEPVLLPSEFIGRPVPGRSVPGRPASRPAHHTSISRRMRILWPAVAAAVLLLVFGTFTVAASAMPGSPLYGLRRIEQNVRASLSSNPADRVRLHLGYASDALTSANDAAQGGNHSAFDDALTTLRSELAAAASELSNIPPGGDHDSLAAQLTSLRRRAIAGLRTDLPALNWSDRLTTTDALAAFGATVPRVSTATAQRIPNLTPRTWHVVVTGEGFASGAQLLVNGQPAGTVVAVSNTTLIASYTASDGQPPEALGVANSDDTAAQTSHLAIIPPRENATPGPANTPNAGNSGDHGSGSGNGGHGGGHGGPPTPSPSAGNPINRTDVGVWR